MTVFDSIIQGTVQGLTEFLPISSSGHLAIAQYFLGIKENNLLFDVALHVGTLLSVVFVYYKLLINILFSSFSAVFKLFSKKNRNKNETIALNIIFSLIPLFFLFIPIPKIGSLKLLATNLAESGNISVVGVSLIATSLLLTIGSLYSYKLSSKKHFSLSKMSEISPWNAFVIGISQLVASIFPGLSRSGTTMSTGLLLGMSREDAIDFSFIMGTPTILAASVLEFKESRELGIHIDWNIVIVGIITSAVVGFLSIKFLKWIVSQDRTWIFSAYSFIVGSLILILKYWNF